MTELLLYAIFASFFGSAGYTLSLLFFTPLVTCNAYLIEPIIAQTLGYAFGLDSMPGSMTAVGTLFAIFGIFQIEKGSKARLRDTDEKYNDERDSSISDLNMSHLSGR